MKGRVLFIVLFHIRSIPKGIESFIIIPKRHFLSLRSIPKGIERRILRYLVIKTTSIWSIPKGIERIVAFGNISKKAKPKHPKRDWKIISNSNIYWSANEASQKGLKVSFGYVLDLFSLIEASQKGLKACTRLSTSLAASYMKHPKRDWKMENDYDVVIKLDKEASQKGLKVFPLGHWGIEKNSEASQKGLKDFT